MWTKLNEDGTYTTGKIVIINVDSDKSKTYNGFKWESNQDELNRMADENAKSTAAMLDIGIDV